MIMRSLKEGQIRFNKNGTSRFKIGVYADNLPGWGKINKRRFKRWLSGNTYYTIEQEVIVRNWKTLFLTKTSKWKQPYKKEWVITNAREWADEELEVITQKYITINRENRLEKLLSE